MVHSGWFHILVIILFFLFYDGKYFLEYLSSPIVASWDGVFHYSLARYYAEHIFPSPFGWVPNWQMGMPWPIGYTPLLHYTLAIISKFILADFLIIFKSFFVFLAFTTPIVVYGLIKKLGFDKLESFIGAIMTIFFLSLPYQLYGDVGVSFGGTFAEGGAYPQYFAFYISLFWLYFMMRSHVNQKASYLAMLLFALVFLSDLPMAEAIFPLYVTIVMFRIFQSKGRLFWRYFWDGFLCLGFIAFWFLPLIETSNYFVTRTFSDIPLMKVLLKTSVLFFGGILGTILATREKRQDIALLGIGTVITLIIAEVPIYKIFPDLPIQPFRLVAEVQFLSALLSAIGIAHVVRLYKSPIIRFVVVSMIFIPFLVFIPPLYKSYVADAQLPSTEKKLIQAMGKNTEGRSTIELGGVQHPANVTNGRTHLKFTWFPTSNQIAALAGLSDGHETIWNVFRESSILSAFTQPIRNSLSKNIESFGVECHLCHDGSFYAQPLSLHIERAAFLGIRYFALNSQQKIVQFTENPSVENVFSAGRWQLFQTKQPVSTVELLGKSPTLVFTKLKNGVRPAGSSYDWLSLNEEWLYQGDMNNMLAFASEVKIDEQDDLDAFDSMLLVEYTYRDQQKALEKLLTYAKNHHVFAFSSKDPLYAQLEEQVKRGITQNIHLIQRTNKIRSDYKKLSTLMDKYTSTQTFATSLGHVQKTKLGMSFMTANAENIPHWYFVKYSYFPWWTDTMGGKVYMGSPAMMLVYTNNNRVELHFQYSIFVWIGTLITVLTTAIFVFRMLKSRISPT
jgi:hypothetical protein